MDGRIKEPEAGTKGICPGCKGKLIAKCGSIKIHHWAHQRSVDCDMWWEPITQWHIEWQNNFPWDWREVIVRHEGSDKFHRADIHTPDGLTIEFQHSPLAIEELEKEMLFIIN